MLSKFRNESKTKLFAPSRMRIDSFDSLERVVYEEPVRFRIPHHWVRISGKGAESCACGALTRSRQTWMHFNYLRIFLKSGNIADVDVFVAWAQRTFRFIFIVYGRFYISRGLYFWGDFLRSWFPWFWAAMTLVVYLKSVSELPGKGDRLAKVSFRGTSTLCLLFSFLSFFHSFFFFFSTRMLQFSLESLAGYSASMISPSLNLSLCVRGWVWGWIMPPQWCGRFLLKVRDPPSPCLSRTEKSRVVKSTFLL